LTFRAGRAVGFRLGGNLASVLLGIGLGVILARILPPREFGIFGVGWGIVAMAEIVGSCGMLQALVQRKTLGAEDEATAGILQLSGALLLGGGLVVAGPTLERLFGMPGLGPLIQVQSVVLVVNGLGLVPTSRLTRRLAFGRLTAIDTGTRVLGGVVSILSALHGVGAIALAIGSVTTGVSRSCLTWIFAPGRTPLKFSLDSAKNLLGYGTGILLIRIFNDFAHRVDVLILGQRLGAEVVPASVPACEESLVPVNVRGEHCPPPGYGQRTGRGLEISTWIFGCCGTQWDIGLSRTDVVGSDG